MMTKIKKDTLLWLMVMIGLVSVLLLLMGRYQVESVNDGVHITVDYEEISTLAVQSEHDLQWWLTFFHEQGCNSVSLKEESLRSLAKSYPDLAFDVVESIGTKLGWKEAYPEVIVENILNKTYENQYIVAKTEDPELAHLIKEGLVNRYPEDFYELYELENASYFVMKSDAEIKAVYREVDDKIRFGFDDQKVKLIQDSGLEVIFRPVNNDQYPEKMVEAYKNELLRHQIPPKVYLFGNVDVIGNPGFGKELSNPAAGNELSEFMADNGMAVALLETGVQRSNVEVAGLDALTVALNYEAVRTFSIAEYIQYRYQYYNYPGSEEIENTIYRAVTERNIRMVYFKPFKWEDGRYVTDAAEYARMFESLESRLAAHGIKIGDFTVMPMHTSNRTLVMLAGISLAALGILWLKQYIRINRKWQLALLGWGALGVVGGMFAAPNTMPALIAFGAAVLFATISVAVFIEQMKKAYVDSINIKWRRFAVNCFGSLLAAFLIALAGGLYVGGILSDSRFLLEIDFFRGVKLAQIIPLCVATVLYVVSLGYGRKESEIAGDTYYLSDLRKLLFLDIKAIYLIGLGVAGGILYYYLARTGQETEIVPTDAEMIARNFLEYTFLARPRTKEFLSGYPLLIAAYLFAHKKVKFFMYPTLIVGAIGITSIINTFTHLRTPLYLSLLRVLYGLGLGVVVGILGLFVILALIRVTEILKTKQTWIEKLQKAAVQPKTSRD